MPRSKRTSSAFDAMQVPPPANLQLRLNLNDWLDRNQDGRSYYIFTDHVVIETLAGHKCAGIGDWIVKGEQGELYACKPNVFAATCKSVNQKNS